MKLAIRTSFFISIVLIFSCDKIDNPFPENEEVNDSSIIWDDSLESKPNNDVRYILLEEFTGHTCTKCPEAAREVDRLTDLYGDKFITIAIHATETFAAPKVIAGAPPGSYQTDHRTDESLIYENQTSFGIGKGLPRGMISRTDESIVKDKWKQECDKIYNNPGQTVANIFIRNFFDDSAKVFRVNISIEWLVAHTGDLNLQVQIMEDNIVDWQLDGSDNIEDFEFDHMFRGSINGAWGTKLPIAEAGSTLDTSFARKIESYLGRGNTLENYTKPDFSDFSIVAYIYKDSPDFEVMQVNMAHLTGTH